MSEYADGLHELAPREAVRTFLPLREADAYALLIEQTGIRR